MKIVLLDNFDSFTYNLVLQLQVMGHEVQVFRNDVRPEFITSQLLDDPTNRLLVLSPGPGAPQEAGCMMKLISQVIGIVPILGICLGHQAIVLHYGGIIGRAPKIVHGKASRIIHSYHSIFHGISSPLTVARYHSLVALSMPTCLDVIATTEDSLVMAVVNENDIAVGFQFHPESILTSAGQQLLENTINYLRMSCHDTNMACVAV